MLKKGFLFMATVPSKHKSQVCDDQIDLFELWDILLAKKLFILGVALLCGLGGFSFVTLLHDKPDQHIYKVYVEIGRYITQTGEIQTLESPHDLVLILNQQTSGAKASVPRGSVSVISLEANHVDPATAKQHLDSTLAFINDRHESFVSRLPGKLLTLSGAVAEPTVSVQSFGKRGALIVTASIMAGLLLGIFGAVVINTLQQRKAVGGPLPRG